jgi:hypothetical protein
VASPAIVNSIETVVITESTTHVHSLPSGRVNGNLLVNIVSKGKAVTFNALAGWTEIVDESAVAGIAILVRQIDGTEAGTITLTSSAISRSASICYQISGAADPATQLPELSTVATGSSVNPNATTVTPTGGSKDYLWISLFGRDGEEADDDTWVTAAPA